MLNRENTSLSIKDNLFGGMSTVTSPEKAILYEYLNNNILKVKSI